MGAHPKNKITRVEQGKRRHGNTPKLLKDLKHSAVPLHKKTLFGKFLKIVSGAILKPNTKKNVKAAQKKQKATDRAIAAGKIPAPKAIAAPASEKASAAAPKKTAAKAKAPAKKSAK